MAQNVLALTYSESGQGDPVLLLDWTPWESSALARALASRYRVISVEPPVDYRHAGSDWDVGRAIERVVESAGLSSYSVVGTSLGADAAFAHARLGGASASALVLISPTVVGPKPSVPWNTPELAVNAMLANQDIPPEGLPSRTRTAGLSAMAQEWQAEDSGVFVLLRDLDCAMLVVYGQEDRLVSREAGRVWKEHGANCNLCYVYDAGHAVTVDRPAALASVVLDFLERRETFIVENRSSLINP